MGRSIRPNWKQKKLESGCWATSVPLRKLAKVFEQYGTPGKIELATSRSGGSSQCPLKLPYIMKWIVGLLLAGALLLSSYAVYKTKRLESETRPQIQLIASAAVAR